MQTVDDMLTYVDQLLLNQYNRCLNAPERLILTAAWEDETYEEVVKKSKIGYKINTIQRAIAPGLWTLLSKLLGQPVGKKSFRAVITAVYNREQGMELPWLVGAQIPGVSKFYGRQRELDELRQLVVTHRCVVLVGVTGIGKRSLVAKLIDSEPQLPFQQILWKPVHYAPDPLQLACDVLQLLGHPVSQTQRLDAQLSDLVAILKTRRCLLVLDTADALLSNGSMGFKQLSEGYLSLFRRVIEETQSCVLLTSQEPIPDIETFALRGLPLISYPLEGLTVADARQIFKEVGLLDEPMWDAIIQSLGRHPLLLRQIANWIKMRLGGSLSSLSRATMQLGIVQYWFDHLFGDPLYLSAEDRQTLLVLATLLTERQSAVLPISELLEQEEIASASVERLIQSALVETSMHSTTHEQLLSLWTLLQKYLLKDPRGLVKQPILMKSA